MLSADEIREKITILNITKVSELTGLNPQTIYRLMRGKNPGYQSLVKLSDFLEKTLK